MEKIKSPVQGLCDPRFTTVHEVFAENFARRDEVGAAVCVYAAGKPVVDLWGGYADTARTRPWERNTIANVASTTKGMVAICAHRLVEQGLLDLDAPVARYWPEFAQAGKAQIPVRWLLSHRAGLPAVRQEMPLEALYDWPAFPTALAATEPWWEPGTRHGYHAITFGYLVGEVIRRISGKSVGRFLSAEVTGPLDADFFIGVPSSEDHRAAEIIPEPPPPPGVSSLFDLIRRNPTSMAGRAFLNPPRDAAIRGSRAWRAAEIPASNGHTTARALARIYGTLAHGGTLDGVHLLHPATIDAAIVEQSCGLDAILSFATRFGLGFMLTQSQSPGEPRPGFAPFGPHARAFGHPGQGGSIGFADLDGQIGFGYVMNQYQTGTPQNPDRRWPALVEAVYASLGAK
jgi:CubicO group peptidase (beta-lactamase class C family)